MNRIAENNRIKRFRLGSRVREPIPSASSILRWSTRGGKSFFRGARRDVADLIADNNSAQRFTPLPLSCPPLHVCRLFDRSSSPPAETISVWDYSTVRAYCTNPPRTAYGFERDATRHNKRTQREVSSCRRYALVMQLCTVRTCYFATLGYNF